jgi:hypothetical protein
MKALITTLALATLLVASASAQFAQAASSDRVTVNGQVIGQDPDANIRFQLKRDPYPVGE